MDCIQLRNQPIILWQYHGIQHLAAMHQRNTLAQRHCSSRMLNGGGGNHHVYARGGQIFLDGKKMLCFKPINSIT